MKRLANFINGQYVAPQKGAYLPKFDPCRDQVIYEVPDSDEVDVAKAIQAARKAFESWSKTSAEKRAEIFLRIASLLEARLDEFATAESIDVGKTLQLAKVMDMQRAIKNFRFFGSRILHKEEQAAEMEGDAFGYVLRQPVGVAGLISPWNLPLYLLTWKLAPAVALGNTVVCKPSELTPHTAYLLGEVLNEAGLPPGVCNIVFGRGEKAGAVLANHPAVPIISFTGGTDTGRKILASGVEEFKRVGLELGGKNATIVFGDVNIDDVIPKVVRSSFLNQGEICLCGERILVQESIYKEFTEKFIQAVKDIRVGDPKKEDTFMGPLISREHLQKVQTLIQQAKADQAKVLCGDEPLDLPADMKNGYFMRPTVLADMSNCSEIHQIEFFGPVVNLIPFKYAHEAPKLANVGPYGLSASVFTKDISRAHKVARELNVGTVWINSWLIRDLRVPFGGMKHSGLGREGGDYSFDFFTEQKTVCVQL